MSRPRRATPLSVRVADAEFTSWQCRPSRGHPSSESTCESRRAADSTSRSPSARRYQTSRRSPGITPCSGSIFHESDSSARQGRTRPVRHRRVIVTHYGGPDALRVVEEECPEPKDGEVRVRVLAAGVSLPDLLMREGVHPETPTLPFTPGWDLIGVVDKGRRRYLRNRTRPDSCRAADPRCLRGVR